MKLEDSDCSVPKFTLNGQTHYAKIVKVYDADSVNIVFNWNGSLTRWATRLAGINAPEIKGGSVEEKKKGIDARDWVRDNYLNKMVWVKCYDFEKYGRLLCDIYLEKNGVSLSDILLEKNMAIPFMRD